jgi:hypothetical protein
MKARRRGGTIGFTQLDFDVLGGTWKHSTSVSVLQYEH